MKRKRDARDEGSRPGDHASKSKNKASSKTKTSHGAAASPEIIHVITGSYDGVLHGFVATLDLSTTNLGDNDADLPDMLFADVFLNKSHSSVRCLALSPLVEAKGAPVKVTLASGGSDEKINLYSLSGNAPTPSNDKVAAVPSLSSVVRQENPLNRSLGSLIHHSSSITQLRFATKSKLLSSSEDNTIAVSRMRDYTCISTFKAPMPKIAGRPSGDTAPLGGAPAGVNDFAVHPSMKIMISVGKRISSMTLWNLVTGKKAGVLEFGKALLEAVGESRHATGEAQGVLFSPNEEGFVISFDRGAAFYDIDAKVKGLVLPTPRTKFHKLRWLPGLQAHVLAVSTDDGRVLFFDTRTLVEPTKEKDAPYKHCKVLGQLGGASEGVATRVKSFQTIELASKEGALIVVTACSDGSVRFWYLDASALSSATENGIVTNGASEPKDPEDKTAVNGDSASKRTGLRQLGRLLGRYDTANRIVCMEAFKALPPLETASKNGENKENGSQAEIADNSEDEFSGFD